MNLRSQARVPAWERGSVRSGSCCSMNSLKGVVFVLILAVVIYFGGLVLMPPAILALPFSLSLYRKINDQSIANFLKFVPALIEIIFGVKVKICGDLTPLKGPCIIVMNHRTRFDWMFLWCFIIRLGDPPRHKIILKSSLKRVPGFGWGMQVGQFLFLSRKWAQDEKYMSDTFAYFNETQYPIQLLLFPEGTDLSDSNKQKSHKFAEQNGLPKYEYLLNTRTKGFIHCVQELRKSPSPLSVVNMSVAYVGSMPQNESDIVAGNWPDEIHFYAKHVPPTGLPRDDKGLEEWVKHCWDEKEKQLENFYLNKKFDAPYMEEEELNRAHSAMYTGIVFWSALLAAVFYCLFYYPLVVLGYFLLTTLFFVAVNLFTQGLDCTALKLHQMGWR